MDDLQMERLKNAVIIAGESFERALNAMRTLIEAMLLDNWGEDPSNLWDEKEHDPMADLARALNAMGGDIDIEKLRELDKLAEDMPPFIHKKMPRPPKYLGPVNRTNYSANRPQRRARSSCRTVKH